MASAPISPSRQAPWGPAMPWLKSSTVIPANALFSIQTSIQRDVRLLDDLPPFVRFRLDLSAELGGGRGLRRDAQCVELVPGGRLGQGVGDRVGQSCDDVRRGASRGQQAIPADGFESGDAGLRDR